MFHDERAWTKASPASIEICFALMLHESLVVSKGPVAVSLEVSMASLSSPGHRQDRTTALPKQRDEHKSVHFCPSTAPFKERERERVSTGRTSFVWLAQVCY